ncbi:Karyogamy protein, KAR9 [Sesbania bispinosa]|nr:Karyogamy protein, KAR9 [Sesbania bispinosa]
MCGNIHPMKAFILARLNRTSQQIIPTSNTSPWNLLQKDLETLRKNLEDEKYFKALANKEKDRLQKKLDKVKAQLKDVEDQYLEAKNEADQAKAAAEESKANLESAQKVISIITKKEAVIASGLENHNKVVI